MINAPNYRKALLEAVTKYLEATPQSVAQGRKVVESLQRPRPYTIGNVLWGPYISMLSDAVYYRNTSELQRFARQLKGVEPFVRRVFLKFDFRPLMSPPELHWFQLLCQVARFLVFALKQENGNSAEKDNSDFVVAYERLQTSIRAAEGNVRLPKREEAKTVYEVIMQQSSALLCGLDVRGIGTSARGLIPQGTYSVIASHQRLPVVPDAAGSLQAVAKALEALTGSEWLVLTVQASGRGVVVGVF